MVKKFIKSKNRGVAHYKIKEEFIANAIHKLRTPLAIIKGNVDLALQEEKVPLFLKNNLRSINHEIRDMSVLLSDLTFLIRKDADFARPMIFKKLDLLKIIERVVKKLAPVLLDKRMKVKVVKKSKVFIGGDKIYIEKLFNNLIGNAIKYTQKGGRILVDFRKEKGMVKVSIKDNGIGIPKKDMPYIFDRFYRVKKIRTANDFGTGLGLAISKSIVEYHGGSIEAKSTLGRGTAFFVSFLLYKSA